jgi:hypothetical protein
MLWESAPSLLRVEYLYIAENPNLSTHQLGDLKFYLDVTSFVTDVLAYVKGRGEGK